MNRTHVLSDLADQLSMKKNSNKSNLFDLPKSSSNFKEGFFDFIVYLFGHNKNTVTVKVTDNLPTEFFFCTDICNIRFSPYPDSMYRIFVYEVACIFDRHPHFKARIQKGAKTVTFQFIPN